MALNLVYQYSKSKTRMRTLTASVTDGTAVLDPGDLRPAVALTNSGDITKTVTTSNIPLGGGVSALTYADGGVGLTGHQTVLAYDGTWNLPVVSTGTTPAPTTTANGTAVYAIVSGTVITGLTLVSTSNTLYGHVDYPDFDYNKVAGTLPVRVGS
jgi:hypothetical protein